jgi:glycosyltransferase involved in cell wall biosynthesis
VRVIVVDDGSPEPAEPIIRRRANEDLLKRIELYRIGVDIPWNRGGARNLGAQQAATDWIVHIDIDHLLPPECAHALLKAEVLPDRWYRFRRFRNGQADETRMKDALPRSQTFGEIKPHIDSYLVTRDLYWQAGGYNEDFSGCLGGGSPFLQELEKLAPVAQLPPDVCLHVYTRDRCPDASDFSLSREPGEFARRKKAMNGNFRGHDPVRFPWTRIL